MLYVNLPVAISVRLYLPTAKFGGIWPRCVWAVRPRPCRTARSRRAAGYQPYSVEIWRAGNIGPTGPAAAIW